MLLTLLRSLVAPLPLVLLATGAGLLWPSAALARRADLILAALVFAVAVTITPKRLRAAATTAWRRAIALVALPLVTLLPLSLTLGLLFEGAEREGLLALGLASTEVAAVGLVAIAGGDAALALLACVLSLVTTAVVAPAVTPFLADADVDPADLVVRFSLVVVVPLAVGLALRSSRRFDGAVRGAETAAMVILALLVYAALGELGDLSKLAGAALAAFLFLAGSAAIAFLVRPLLGEWRSGGLSFTLRDFAVAAALAAQLDAPGASATAAVYGVLMLVAAAAATSAVRRRQASRGVEIRDEAARRCAARSARRGPR